MYNAIVGLNTVKKSCVSTNDYLTNWFNCADGVRQGDHLSPPVFSIFINDLATEVKELNKGVQMSNEKICLLLYADDIVLLTENEHDMQHVLDTLDKCMKWGLNVNIAKSNGIHFRRGQLPLTS